MDAYWWKQVFQSSGLRRMKQEIRNTGQTMHGASTGFWEATMLHRSDFFPNISGSRNCSWGKYKECIQKETNTFSQLLWSGLAGIAALCSGVGAGEVKGAALGHHQQNKPAPCLHREDRFFNNESKIIKERERGSCTTPGGGNVPMGLSVFTVFTPSALHLLTLARTFSNEAGLTSEKQMRKTSWWGKTENNP